MSVVASIETGRRNIMNTSWPVENLIYRDGPREWRVAFSVCNGIASNSRVYRTRKEAIEAAGIKEVR